MQEEKLKQILAHYVPLPAVNYCLQLWQESPFEFKLRKKRISKIGDFTCGTKRKPRITVNNNLNPHLFLMTYVHEVAHLKVHLKHGFKAEAHGAEWKHFFRQLMVPLMSPEFFPEPLLSGLLAHMQNPMASSYSDSELTRLFRTWDTDQQTAVLLSQVPEGSVFQLQGRWFTKGKLRRTRVVCNEVKSRRQYLVPADIEIGNVQLPLL
ncbi:MAG: transcription elongation protein SprT [Bacteroidetes bacterium]|nr:transcription elongation protein SprT [Bacteroidota bacterium]MBS1539032.1 transcription elongation protein SprT [Bacteroidota bacterium]